MTTEAGNAARSAMLAQAGEWTCLDIRQAAPGASAHSVMIAINSFLRRNLIQRVGTMQVGRKVVAVYRTDAVAADRIERQGRGPDPERRWAELMRGERYVDARVRAAARGGVPAASRMSLTGCSAAMVAAS